MHCAGWLARIRVLILFALVVAPSGCDPGAGRGEVARNHFQRLVSFLREGSLTKTYESALTAGQKKDLESLLGQVREVLDEGDVTALRAALEKHSFRLGALATLGAAKWPVLGILGGRIKEVPQALGLDDPRSFLARDLVGHLGRLEQGLGGDLLRSPDLQARISSVDIKVVAERGDWARLRFASKAPDGAVVEDTLEVVAEEGTWLPTNLTADWNAAMDQLRGQISQLKEEKARDPEYLRKLLQELLEGESPVF